MITNQPTQAAQRVGTWRRQARAIGLAATAVVSIPALLITVAGLRRVGMKLELELSSLPFPGELVVTRPWIFVLIAAAGAVCGFLSVRRRGPSTMLFMIGLVAVLFTVGSLMHAIVAVIAPLYEYQPI